MRSELRDSQPMNSSPMRKKILADIAALQRDLEAFDRLHEKYGSASVRARKQESHDEARSVGPQLSQLPLNGSNGFSLAAAAWLAVEAFPISKVFTKDDVALSIHEKHPGEDFKAASLASQLWRLQKAEKIVVVEKGAGKKPSRYRRELPEAEGYLPTGNTLSANSNTLGART